MPISLDSGSGPYFKYDARFGELKYNDEKVDEDFKFALDLENTETGWICFAEGKADLSHLSHWSEKNGPNPEPGTADKLSDYKVGFRVTAHSKLFNDPKQLTANSAAANSGFEALFNTWEKEKGEHPNKLPVVQMASTVQHGKNKNYAPVFKIVGWTKQGAETSSEEKPASKAAVVAEGDDTEF
tara:strand:- start:524 stop:1075 length:552 start_codon:yes stop_codon:yes gene_type:complete